MTGPPRPPVVVPRGLEVAVAWAWRLLLLALAVVVVGVALGRVALLTASVVAALLLTALLHPLAVRLTRHGVPRRLAAVGVFLGFVGLAAGVLGTLGTLVARQLADLASGLSLGSTRLAEELQSLGLPLDPEQVEQLRDSAREALPSGEVLTGALLAAGTVLDVVTGALLALFVALVLLLDGRTVWQWLVRLLPRAARQPADEAGERAWSAVTAYLRGIVLVALTDATLIAVALLVIGVPSVAPLAALTFLGAFVPYVGASVAGMAAVAVALATLGGTEALLTLGAVLLVQTIDGYVVEPLVLGKVVRLHPLAVVVAITLGGLLAGVGGAVVAVPLAGAVNAAATHLAHRGEREPAD